MANRTIVISANAAWYLVNFRSGLIGALVDKGYRVTALAAADAAAEARFKELGCEFIALPIDSRGLSPFGDIRTFLAFYRLFRRNRPFAFLGFTVKPNIYGSLAAGLLGVHAINNISGLGTAFIRRNWLTVLVKLLYRAALSRSATVFFENGFDRNEFVEAGLVAADKTQLVPGAGVDPERFAPQPRQRKPGQSVHFLFIGRVLRDKGVVELVDAARSLRADNPNLHFSLLGFLGAKNRTAIDRATVDGWVAEGVIDYLGACDDVRPYIADADCIVLPSYREGTSGALLEAAAMARPLVATDVPGCREVVEDDVNGYLCAVRDAIDLADKLGRMANLSAEERERMGRAGREKIIREFDQSIVIGRFLARLEQLEN